MKVNTDSDLSFFFLKTGTMLETQSGCCSSQMKPHSMSFWTSASVASNDVRSKLLLLLFNRLSIRFDVDMMHDHLRIETRHVFVSPSKDVYIFFYKRYKILLLHRRQTFTYRDGLWVYLITHINLDYFFLCRRIALFKMIFPLEIKLLSPWINVEWLNVLFSFHLTGWCHVGEEFLWR